tara:strand:- start:55 stop:543 length:489 start_codon:yes stop_codon:yes gene_type:complete
MSNTGKIDRWTKILHTGKIDRWTKIHVWDQKNSKYVLINASKLGVISVRPYKKTWKRVPKKKVILSESAFNVKEIWGATIQCQHCKISAATQKHHITYFPEKTIWLCFDCHYVIHHCKHPMYSKYKQYEKGDSYSFYNYRKLYKTTKNKHELTKNRAKYSFY